MSLRVFLALPLARYFQSDLSGLLTPLKQKYPEIRWIPPSEIHVTLHFFGSIEEEGLAKASSLIKPLASTARPLNLYLEGLGAFPDVSRPRVIWTGLKGDIHPLKFLRQQIEECLSQNGYSCEEREFRPHATIGRIKDGIKVRFNPINFAPTSSQEIKELILFKSVLTPQGAHYEILSTYPFGPA